MAACLLPVGELRLPHQETRTQALRVPRGGQVKLIGGISLNFPQDALSASRLSFRAALRDLLLCL